MARKEVKSIKTILYIAHYYLFKTKLNLRLATSTCQNSFWSNHRIFENSNIRKEIKRVSENHFLSWTQHLFVKTVGDQADHTHYSKLHLIKHTILSKKKKKKKKNQVISGLLLLKYLKPETIAMKINKSLKTVFDITHHISL